MKPTLHYDYGTPDHDRLEKEEYLYEREQENKSDLKREDPIFESSEEQDRDQESKLK